MLTRSFTWQKQRGLYQSLVTPSLAVIQTPGHQVSNCKILYFTANAGSTWPYFLAFPLRQDIVFSSLNRIFEVSSLREEREFVFLCVVFNRELKQTTTAGSWQKRHQTKVNQQKHWLCTCVLNICTFLTSHLQNNNVKWQTSTYFGERELQWQSFRIFFWNLTLSLHV